MTTERTTSAIIYQVRKRGSSWKPFKIIRLFNGPGTKSHEHRINHPGFDTREEAIAYIQKYAKSIDKFA